MVHHAKHGPFFQMMPIIARHNHAETFEDQISGFFFHRFINVIWTTEAFLPV